MPQARDEAGNIWETDAQGNPTRLLQAAGGQQGQVFTLPPDPVEQAREQQRQANEQERLSLARQADARAGQAAGLAAQAAQAAQAENQRKALEWAATHNPDGSPKTAAGRREITAKANGDALAMYNMANSIEEQVARIRELYARGPGSTKGIMGLQDFLPTENNQAFDKAANRLRSMAKTATGTTGGENNSLAEMQLNLGAYIPSSNNFDTTNVESFTALLDMAANAKRQATMQLGGTPDAAGNIQPLPENAKNAFDQSFFQANTPEAAGFGATEQTKPLPPAYQQEHAAFLAQNAGRVDPEAYVRFRQELDARYGFQAPDDEGMRAHAQDLNRFYQKGGRTFAPVKDPTVPLSGIDKLRNDMVSNPIGAGVAGLADAGGLGVPTMLAPDQMAALGDANPMAMGLGQVAGAIGATSAIGKAGGAIAGRVAPNLLQGGKMAQFGRNLATDLAYSGAYGQNANGDPGSAMLAGGIGSVMGQGVGSGIGRALTGVQMSKAAQLLKDRNIPLTIGQTMGGVAKGLEDRMAGLPVVGDLVNARRSEGLQAFNQRAMQEAGAPIGYTPSQIGEAGVNDLLSAAGRSYDNATAGVQVGLDPQFMTDMGAVAQAGRNLPDDYAKALDDIGRLRIGPAIQSGQMTGEGYQQAMRGLKSARTSASSVGKSGFDQEYRDVLTMAQNALRGNMERGGGQSVVDGLSRTDQAYRSAKTLAAAVNAARNGSRSGEAQVFMPSQLNDAAARAAQKYGGGRQFADLIDAGQKVLPSSVPDSGTAGRLAMMAIPGLATGGAAYGAGTNFAEGDTKAGMGYATAALLALGGTKAGQSLITKALTGRPESVKALGAKIRQRKGLVGSAAAPLFIESGQ